MNRTMLVIILFVAALATGLVMKFMPREGFSQREVGKPVSGSPMGPYDEQPRGWAASEPMPVGNLPQNVALEQNKLMYLQGNSSAPECCPASGLSSDSGCICLTGQDRKEMNSRFGNR
jgi:hypothetical protein